MWQISIKISDKFKYSDDGLKHVIGYKEDDIVKPLCIILPEVSEYIKNVEIEGKKNVFLWLKMIVYW